jgi:pimeloyl-ACP methyl ester carboxylesterase
LEEQGHRVLAVDLPGHGERIDVDLAKIGLQDYVDTIIQEIMEEDLRDVILVGHSLGGITIPYVAERMGERIKRLVFISCVLPDEGQSALETLDPLDRFLYKLIVALTGARRRGARIPAFLAKRKFCNDMDKEMTKWLLKKLVPEPIGPWEEPISRRGLPADIPKTYIVLTEDRALRPAKQRRMLRNLGESEVAELAAGHNAMLTRPKELAKLLLRHA